MPELPDFPDLPDLNMPDDLIDEIRVIAFSNGDVGVQSTLDEANTVFILHKALATMIVVDSSVVRQWDENGEIDD